MSRIDKDDESTSPDAADLPPVDSGFDAFGSPNNLDDIVSPAGSQAGAAPNGAALPPPLPSLGLEDEQALDIGAPMPPAMFNDSTFEPDTIFDADSRSDASPAPRELKIAPEHTNYVPEVGHVLNERFEIEKLIAIGVLGVVYLVQDLRLKDRKALKLMHPSLMENPSAAERFIAEIKTLQKLSHENIVRVYDFGKTDRGDLAFFTMEYVEGATLASLLKKKGGRLPLEKSLSLAYQILDTLTYAHQYGSHRNLKPLNVMVRPSGKIVLLNFGLSGAAESPVVDRRAVLGSIQYLAPEQRIDSSASSPQIDIFAIGVLLYQLLTGVVPMGDAIPPSRINRALPRRLDRVIMRCLAPHPQQRYATAAATKAALQRAEKPSVSAGAVIGLVITTIAGLALWWIYG